MSDGPGYRGRLAVVLALLLFVAPAAPLRAGSGRGSITSEVPIHRAQDPNAPVVTARSLLADERFWPYQAALVRPWRQQGAAEAPPVGLDGVLIRVEAGGTARIDFGRDGIHSVPLDVTDLVERANRVRLGELAKIGPNFVVAIGPRLLDPRRPGTFRMTELAGYRHFLCLFADPEAKAFRDLVTALAPLREREEMLTVFFPQGRVGDERVRQKLRSLGWLVPFAYAHLSEPYTRTLMADPDALPAVSLQTAEGRLLFESRIEKGGVTRTLGGLEAALAATDGATTAAAATSR